LAESEYKMAVDASNASAATWMELAAYYARRHQNDQMLAALRSGVDADARSASPHGTALVDAARLLARSHTDPQLAIQLLQQYLASPNQSADSPAFRVRYQLARLLEQQGDHEAARQQNDAAGALAHEYRPPAPKN
jgi:hypothetical protein